MSNRRRVLNPNAQEALEHLKYEVAQELGLDDDIQQKGWGEMTTREVGKIGGGMVRKMIRFAEAEMDARNGQIDMSQPDQGGAS